MVYETPPRSSDGVPVAESTPVPFAPTNAQAPYAGPPPVVTQAPSEPIYSADPRLPFAPAADWSIPSMPAYAGAPSAQFRAPHAQLAEEPAFKQPISGHVLGVVTIAVGIGVAAGIYYGGPFGAVAGSLFGGSVANAYKAVTAYKSGTPDGDAEAKVSATYAILAAALGGWVAYKFAKPRTGYERNPEAAPEGTPPPKAVETKEALPAKPGLCRPRRAYPIVAKACEEQP